jgi:hypothetical protein
MKIPPFFILFIVLGCGIKKHIDSREFVLNAHAMIYNTDEAKIYLFGGANEKEVLDDLWVLDNETWVHVTTEKSPVGRTFASMAYDEINHRIVLFGGSRVLFGHEASVGNLLNDLWEFKDKKWNKINTPVSPSPRAEAALVFDSTSGKLVLFGGYTIENGNYLKLDDTWEFENNHWKEVASKGPSPRHGVCMAYDPVHQSILLFGGSTVDKQYGVSSGQSWIFKNQNWSYLDMLQPPGIFNASMIYDKEEVRFIRFGGWNGVSRVNETWSFKNNMWQQIHTETSPSIRNHSGMIYHEATSRTLLFGGHNGTEVFGDLWEFKNNQWKNISDTQPKLRVKNNH